MSCISHLNTKQRLRSYMFTIGSTTAFCLKSHYQNQKYLKDPRNDMVINSKSHSAWIAYFITMTYITPLSHSMLRGMPNLKSRTQNWLESASRWIHKLLILCQWLLYEIFSTGSLISMGQLWEATPKQTHHRPISRAITKKSVVSSPKALRPLAIDLLDYYGWS